jgi:hypothetical protein
MTLTRVASLLAVAAVLGLLGCKSEPQNPYPQGYPQGWPQAVPQGYPQQQAPLPNQGMPGYPQPVQQPQAAPGATVGGLIPWAELAKALPLAAPGWVPQGQAEGETAAMMGFGVSTTRVKLAQGALQASVEIVDNAMAAGMAGMGFAMAPTVDSSDSRVGRVNIGTYPGLQTFHKQENKADVVVIVGNRLMVTVNVQNTPAETPALQLAQLVNYQFLQSLIGG